MQGQLIINAALAKLEAERAEALAILHLYLNTPVGVPSHSDIIKEIIDATQKLSGADSTISTLQQLVSAPEKAPEESSNVKN